MVSLYVEPMCMLPMVFYGSQEVHPLSPFHTNQTDDDEGNAKELSHVEEHTILEIHLNVFGVFDEKRKVKMSVNTKPK